MFFLYEKQQILIFEKSSLIKFLELIGLTEITTSVKEFVS